MRYPFGIDFHVIWQYDPAYPPHDGAENVYLFDEEPTLAEAKAGTGAIQTIATWATAGNNAHAKSITVQAIDDPNPDDAITDKDYWLGINYEIENNEQVQTDIFRITLRRHKGNIVGTEANLTNIKQIFPEITSYATDSQITNFISIARSQVESDFNKKGLTLDRVANLQDFWLGMAYKVISLIGISEFKEEGDRHYVRYREYGLMYQEHITGLRVEVDNDQSGDAEEVKTGGYPYLVNLK